MLEASNHWYTVVFKNDGEAVTYAKLAVANPGPMPLTEYAVEMPNVALDAVHFYQMTETPFDASSDWDYWVSQEGGTFNDQELKYSKTGNFYRLPLLSPVAPGSATAIVVNYSTKGFVTESLGVHKFTYSTIKVPEKIVTVSVCKEVENGLILNGPEFLNGGSMLTESIRAASELPGLGISSSTAADIFREIGFCNQTVRVKNIAPNASLTLRGKYATSWLMIYLLQFILIMLGLVIFSFVLIRIILAFKKRRAENIAAGTINQNLDSVLRVSYILPGLISALSLAGFSQFMGRLFEIGSFQHLYAMHPFFHRAVWGGMIILVIFLAVGPAALAGLRKGWRAFVMALIYELFWCATVAVVCLALYQVRWLYPYIYNVFNG